MLVRQYKDMLAQWSDWGEKSNEPGKLENHVVELLANVTSVEVDQRRAPGPSCATARTCESGPRQPPWRSGWAQTSWPCAATSEELDDVAESEPGAERAEKHRAHHGHVWVVHYEDSGRPGGPRGGVERVLAQEPLADQIRFRFSAKARAVSIQAHHPVTSMRTSTLASNASL